MTNQQITSTLSPLLGSLRSVLSELENPTASERLAELIRDTHSGFFSVVLLGEFNRGKSTVLNALIGRDLLPTDILPTTAAIHVLRYSATPLLRVHYCCGTTEDLELSNDTLGRFVSAENAAQIEYLEIGIPEAILSGGIVFVDTPGVDDLNRQRAEITFRFVPRADAVIFVLDATAAVRRTEAEFLESSILASGIERLIFVANFADRLEPDDEADVMQTIKNRLATALGPGERTVVLVSARQAVRARAGKSDDQWRDSGFADLAAAIDCLKRDGIAQGVKAKRSVRRALAICSELQSELERLIEVREATDGELQQQQRVLVRINEDAGRRRSRIADWIGDREREILAMTAKSLESFGTDLEQQIRDRIMEYRHPDFGQFVEKIPLHVKCSLKGWVDSHASPVAALLQQVRRGVCDALKREFRKDFVLGSYRPQFRFESEVDFVIAGESVSSTTQAGLIAGSLMAVMSFAGFAVLGPIIGLAGYPYLQGRLLEHKLNSAKAKLLPEVSRAVRETVASFTEGVMNKLRSEIRNIGIAAEQEYDREVSLQQQRVADELAHRRYDQSRLATQITAMRDAHGRNANIGRSLQDLLNSIESEQAAA